MSKSNDSGTTYEEKTGPNGETYYVNENDFRRNIMHARERARKFRREADSDEHREYWGGRYSAYTMVLDMMEMDQEELAE